MLIRSSGDRYLVIHTLHLTWKYGCVWYNKYDNLIQTINMATKKAEVKKAVKKGDYTLEVSVNDIEYKGTGESMEDALAGFVNSPDFPFAVKTAVVMKFSDGKKKGTQTLRALMGRRMFNAASHKPVGIEIQARKMEERMA